MQANWYEMSEILVYPFLGPISNKKTDKVNFQSSHFCYILGWLSFSTFLDYEILIIVNTFMIFLFGKLYINKKILIA